jgi:hypothetical protein
LESPLHCQWSCLFLQMKFDIDINKGHSHVWLVGLMWDGTSQCNLGSAEWNTLQGTLKWIMVHSFIESYMLLFHLLRFLSGINVHSAAFCGCIL